MILLSRWLQVLLNERLVRLHRLFEHPIFSRIWRGKDMASEVPGRLIEGADPQLYNSDLAPTTEAFDAHGAGPILPRYGSAWLCVYRLTCSQLA